MFGLQGLFPSWEGKLLASILIAAAGIGSAYFLRRAGRRLSDRVNPVAVDLGSSILVVGLVVATALAVADVWGQTRTLLGEIGVLQLDARAPQVAVTVVIVVAIQVLVGIVTRLLNDVAAESQTLTRHQREVSLRATQVALWAGGAVVLLGVWNVDVAGLLVGAGFAGIVVGLAARKTIGSLIAGFVLMLSRPFEVGDWVVLGDNEGVVSDITLMSTRIQGFDGEYVVVPNDVVGNEIVSNRSRNGQLRTDIEVGIDYDDDVQRARELTLAAVEERVEEHPDLFGSPSPAVHVDRFGDSAVVLIVHCWIEQPTPARVYRARDELIQGVKGTLQQAGIRIPYPQRELSNRGETDRFGSAEPNRTDADAGRQEERNGTSG
ncbi:MAG: mechanosensitive ion channel family protein [Haloferacaceae archaeon]